MMERRLTEVEGGNCTISNLRAKIGQLMKELERLRITPVINTVQKRLIAECFGWGKIGRISVATSWNV